MRYRSLISATTLLLALGAAGQASAGALINNGGFEAGFSSWSLANQASGDGTFAIQSGTSSPVNGDPVPAPPEGTNAAMTDAGAPGSHVLYQDFVANTPIRSAALSFQLFIGNRATLGFATPTKNSLDFSILNLNQQARVDIVAGGSNPFSIASSDVLLNIYATKKGDPLVSGYTTITKDLTSFLSSHIGQSLRLRFAEVDNADGPLQVGVDNVVLTSASAVPEPSTIFTAAMAICGGLLFASRRRRQVAA